jgi:PAS domain S-box-containing protein
MIVEDEAIVVTHLRIHLTQLGYQVVGTAAKGERALALAAEVRPDLVLMDIGLQGPMDGIETAIAMRRRFQIPVVFLTAHAERTLLQRAKLAEPFGYIIKPVKERDLEVSIEIALHKHQLERKLQDSEERHRTIIETAMDGFRLVDLEGNLHEVNDTYCQMIGYSRQELLTMRVHDLEATQTAATVAAQMQKIKEQGRVRFESRHRRKDGSFFDIEISSQYRPGQEERVMTFMRDVTDRKRVETHLEIRRQILQILNEPGEMRGAMQQVVSTLLTLTGADAVGIRLQEGDDFPYFAQQGFSEEFLHTDHSQAWLDAGGGAWRDHKGKVCRECICGYVLSGEADPANPFFTPGGSFWINDTFSMPDLPAAEALRFLPCNRCMHHGYASMALMPIHQKDRVVGLIQINSRRKGFFSLETIGLLEGNAEHIGAALLREQANKALLQSATDLHVLAVRLQTVREEERATLSRELHDSLGQHLTALQVGLMTIDRHLQTTKPPDLTDLNDRIVAMVPIVERLTEQTQTLCTSLRSAVLDDLGLVAAIEWQVEDTAKRSGLAFTLSLPDELELAQDIALALFRIVQEALTNVVRHARATQVEIRLHAQDDKLELTIRDNGVGCTPEMLTGIKALGLLGMRERVSTFGGRVELLSDPGHGTTVRVHSHCSKHQTTPPASAR